jgi:hypothetical protein
MPRWKRAATWAGLVCAAGLLLSGCFVRSLHPFLAISDAAFDPALVGTWQSQDENGKGKASITFTRAGETGYELEYRDPEVAKVSRYKANLGAIGKNRCLDITPVPEKDLDDHYIAAHSLWRIALKGDTLTLEQLDYDWLKALLATQPGALDHEVVEGDIVLTASTEDLQRFILRYGDDPKAFSAKSTWKKK